jgi:hypothetical protein
VAILYYSPGLEAFDFWLLALKLACLGGELPLLPRRHTVLLLQLVADQQATTCAHCAADHGACPSTKQRTGTDTNTSTHERPLLARGHLGWLGGTRPRDR